MMCHRYSGRVEKFAHVGFKFSNGDCRFNFVRDAYKLEVFSGQCFIFESRREIFDFAG